MNYDDYTWDLIIIALRGQDRTRIHEYNRAQVGVELIFLFNMKTLRNFFKRN